MNRTRESEPADEETRRTARQPPPRDLPPNRETPRAAIDAAAAIIATHGITYTIRAFDIALREAPQPAARAAADVVELTRLIGMRRRYAEIAPGIAVRVGKAKP